MAAHERSPFPHSGSYHPHPNVFYETEVKRDSEIQLNDQQAQELLRKNDHQSQAPLHGQNSISGHSFDSRSLPTPSSPIVSSPAQDMNNSHIGHNMDQKQQDLSRHQSSPHINSSSPPLPLVPGSSNDPASLDEVNKVLKAQSEDFKRLCQTEKTHVCMTCYKSFRNKPQLTQHELVHNNVRKHVCSYCEKAFKQVCHLNQHIRVHTGERPYKCDVESCGRSFAQLSNLNHHKKNHEEHVKRDIARQFRCEVCDRSYATNQSLNTHKQKLHSNLKAAEGSVSCPIVTSPTTPKRRRSSAKSLGSTANTPDIIDNLDDSGEFDLPTQVKVKPRYLPPGQSNLMVRISTPPGNEDRDKTTKPRTSLPLPLAFTQSQGHDHFNQALLDNNHPISNQILHHTMGNINTSQQALIFSQSPQLIMSSSVHPSVQPAHVQMSAPLPLTTHSASPNPAHMLSESDQRKLMQAQMDDASDRGYLAAKSLPPLQSYSPSLQLHDHMEHVDRKPSIEQLSQNKPQHAHQQIAHHHQQQQQQQQQHSRSETPSHVTHHFPKHAISSEANSRSTPESQAIFNPAFTSHQDRSIPTSTYRSNQY